MGKLSFIVLGTTAFTILVGNSYDLTEQGAVTCETAWQMIERLEIADCVEVSAETVASVETIHMTLWFEFFNEESN